MIMLNSRNLVVPLVRFRRLMVFMLSRSRFAKQKARA
jgi:hypothetical protein